MIALVDMGLSNLGSVALALVRAGASFQVTGDPAVLAQADAAILPGVGAFGDGMRALMDKGLVEPLRLHAAAGKPLLGICLGMQLLADTGEEHGFHRGLGLLPGRVARLPLDRPGCRVPNMGWCDVSVRADRGPLAGLEDEPCFYFAHSYHFLCADPDHQAATLDFGGLAVTAAVASGNILGLQFHPEKSQAAGLEMMRAWAAGLADQGRA